MPVKRRHAKQRRAEVTPEMRAYLTDELEYLYFFENPEISAAWAQLGAEILESWVLVHPGTRPHMFWRLDAPEPGRLSNGGPPGGAPNRLVIPCTLPSPADQEAFLRRHDLRLRDELELLTAD
jgi:hypothetical protein